MWRAMNVLKGLVRKIRYVKFQNRYRSFFLNQSLFIFKYKVFFNAGYLQDGDDHGSSLFTFLY